MNVSLVSHLHDRVPPDSKCDWRIPGAGSAFYNRGSRRPCAERHAVSVKAQERACVGAFARWFKKEKCIYTVIVYNYSNVKIHYF